MYHSKIEFTIWNMRIEQKLFGIKHDTYIKKHPAEQTVSVVHILSIEPSSVQRKCR